MRSLPDLLGPAPQAICHEIWKSSHRRVVWVPICRSIHKKTPKNPQIVRDCDCEAVKCCLGTISPPLNSPKQNCRTPEARAKTLRPQICNALPLPLLMSLSLSLPHVTMTGTIAAGDTLMHRYPCSPGALEGPILQFRHLSERRNFPCNISLGDDAVPANFLGFRGLATLLPHFCQLSVPEVGVCGVYPESP